MEDVTSKEKKKEKTEFTISAEERVLLSRLALSACAVVIFFVLVVLILHIGIFSDAPPVYLFVSALISALLFLFIVIYNF